MQLNPILLRLNARKALKGHWQTALVAAFSAGIFITVYQVALQVNGQKLLAPLLGLISQDYPLEYVTTQFNLTLLYLPAALYILSLFLSPVLQLGLKRYYLLRLSGQESGLGTVFSRMGIFVKAFLLEWLIQIKTLLWGLVPMVPYAAMIYFLPQINYALIRPLTWLASVAMVVSMLLASYRYAMAPFALAEDSGISVFNAVKLSKGWMKGNIGNLFMTQIGFFGWMILRAVLPTLFVSLFGTVISIALELFFDLALSVYMTCTYAAFYKNLTHTDTPKADDSFETYIKNATEDQ